MGNPFVYGGAVTKENFCDRGEEVRRLEADLLNSQKVFLISSRKMGKTSLARVVQEKIKEMGMIAVFVDMESFSSYKGFLSAYASLLMKESTVSGRAAEFVRNVLPGVRAELRFDGAAYPAISFGYSRTEVERVATTVYNIPAVLAERRKRKVVVVFDEFQEILKLDGKQIEGIMRGVIQYQHDVGYVFAGSKKHLLTDMASSPERPFYRIGPIMYLEKIPEAEFTEFIKAKFVTTEVGISDRTIHEIIEWAENMPYYVQMLCHELWDYGILKRQISETDIQIVIHELVSHRTQIYYLEWSRMILSKRQLLKAIAIDGGRGVLSHEFLERNELGYPSSVSRTLLSLTDEGYLDRSDDGEYHITDLLFREWIRGLKIGD